MLKMDGYDDCIAGVVSRIGQEDILCYDKGKVITKLMSEGMTEEDAFDHFEYNMIGSYVGECTPCFIVMVLPDDFIHDPVHEEDGQWYFWDATWADRNGPFASREAAEEALDYYCKTELGPAKDV